MLLFPHPHEVLKVYRPFGFVELLNFHDIARLDVPFHRNRSNLFYLGVCLIIQRKAEMKEAYLHL